MIKPTTTALTTTGGSGTSHLVCILLDKYAAARVAKVPNTMSTGPPGPRIFAIKHPTASPGTATGVSAGNTVKASANLTCTCP